MHMRYRLISPTLDHQFDQFGMLVNKADRALAGSLIKGLNKHASADELVEQGGKYMIPAQFGDLDVQAAADGSEARQTFVMSLSLLDDKLSQCFQLFAPAILANAPDSLYL